MLLMGVFYGFFGLLQNVGWLVLVNVQCFDRVLIQSFVQLFLARMNLLGRLAGCPLVLCFLRAGQRVGLVEAAMLRQQLLNQIGIDATEAHDDKLGL